MGSTATFFEDISFIKIAQTLHNKQVFDKFYCTVIAQFSDDHKIDTHLYQTKYIIATILR